MEHIPLISILVPVYHVEKTLRRCLDSLLRQSLGDFEILLINDGGNAAETAICEEYAAQDTRIVYRYQENRGISAARNTGLSLARGRWLMFVDSDDWVDEDFCRKAWEAAEQSGAQIAIFDLMYTLGDSREGTPHRSAPEAGVYPAAEILRERLTGRIAGYVWNKLYVRSLWEGIEFPVGELWEDDAVMHEILDRAEHIVILHDILYYKPGREDSLTAVASRSNESSRWLYRQRCRRFDYLRRTHPEFMEIESGVMTGVALHYAACLAKERRDKDVQIVSAWLRERGLLHMKGSRSQRIAYSLLVQSPALFAAAIRTRSRLKHMSPEALADSR